MADSIIRPNTGINGRVAVYEVSLVTLPTFMGDITSHLYSQVMVEGGM
jgi:hypothetical protein